MTCGNPADFSSSSSQKTDHHNINKNIVESGFENAYTSILTKQLDPD